MTSNRSNSETDSVTKLATALLNASINKETSDGSGERQHNFLFDPTGRIGGHQEDGDEDDVDSVSRQRTLRVSRTL